MIFGVWFDVYVCFVGCYMLFYLVGSGFGVIVVMMMYVCVGWIGVCVFGVVVSVVVFGVWVVMFRCV